ncbi:hypothetical protein SAURM35S_07361 [Streptomyces aurantiogriseus]
MASGTPLPSRSQAVALRKTPTPTFVPVMLLIAPWMVPRAVSGGWTGTVTSALPFGMFCTLKPRSSSALSATAVGALMVTLLAFGVLISWVSTAFRLASAPTVAASTFTVLWPGVALSWSMSAWSAPRASFVGAVIRIWRVPGMVSTLKPRSLRSFCASALRESTWIVVFFGTRSNSACTASRSASVESMPSVSSRSETFDGSRPRLSATASACARVSP